MISIRHVENRFLTSGLETSIEVNLSGTDAYDRSFTDESGNVSASRLAKMLYKRFFGLPKIEKVIYNDPATVVLWKDGTKTVVKATGEKFDREKGLMAAIAKKSLGNKGNFNNVIHKWVNQGTTK